MRRFIAACCGGRGEASRDLSREEALEAARMVVNGACSDSQAGGLLVALRAKGASAPEIGAFAEALRERAGHVSAGFSQLPMLLDCAGAHEGRGAFAASLPVALLCAAAGLPILLHAAPGFPHKPGCSLHDVLLAAGHQPAAAGSEVAESLQRHQLGYYADEAFCPPLAQIRRLRDELGLPSIFDVAEKFVNCGKARRLLLGLGLEADAHELASMPLMEEVDKLVMVEGLDGGEILPLHKVGLAWLLSRGKRLRHLEMDPATFHLGGEPRRGFPAAEQAALVEKVLSGEEHAAFKNERNLVLYNAASRLWTFGGRASMNEGIQEASELLKSGKCLPRYLSWLRRGQDVAQAA